MYFGWKVEATRGEGFERTFVCAACGLKRAAIVYGRGRAIAHAPFFLGASEAEGRASEEARYAASDNARLTLDLCPCPRCGARKRGALLGFLLITAVKLALFAGLFSIAAALIGALWAWLLVPVLVAVVYAFDFHWRWTGLHRRVLFRD